MPRSHTVVIGGGIAGLAAAWRLAHPADKNARPTSITVLEASPHLGGKIQTSNFAGLLVDNAADAFLARVPEARMLCDELGIADELISPDASGAYVWSRGELHRFPTATVLGLPSDLDTIAASGIISKQGILRARADAVLAGSVGRESQDPSIGELVGQRLGDEIVDRLIDPLLGGINAGNVRQLSAMSVAPQLKAISDNNPSLLAGARSALESAPKADGPMFFATPNGMQQLVDTLVTRLETDGVELEINTAVTELSRFDDAWHVVSGTRQLACNAVVVATPAPAAAQLLRKVAPAAARQLDAIEYASVAMIRLAYSSDSIKRDLDGSGFVVPAVENKLITACSWASSKWNRLSGDAVIMRASAGRFDDHRALALSDEDLITSVHDELNAMVGLEEKPLVADVIRWNKALPQYFPGHQKRVATIESELGKLSHIAVAGAAYGGIGIPACIKSGWNAAVQVSDRGL